MKTKSSRALIQAGMNPRACFVISVLALSGVQAFAQTMTTLRAEMPSVMSNSAIINHKDPNSRISFSVSMTPPSIAALEQFATSVSDPKSENYQNFLTPAQVGNKFGASQTDINKVTSYLKSKGIKIELVPNNRLTVLASGTVKQIESAFGTKINNYRSLKFTEPVRRDYYSFSSDLKLPSNISSSVYTVSGLQNYSRAIPRALTVTQTRVLYSTAGFFSDGFHGEGRTIAISNWDGFRLSNLPLFYTQYSLPTPTGGVGSNVRVVAISGGSGSGTAGGEGDLDIQMVLGMAPKCNFIIYDGGGDLTSVLTVEANDNKADIISESWGWNLTSSEANSAHLLHLAMTAQGITYMAATGDYGTTLEPYSYPNYEPEVLQIGGTIATVDSIGNRLSEVGWSGSGGGWSTNSSSFNKRPSWQTGTGVPTSVNYRMCPDISYNAAGNNTGAYEFVYNGSVNGNFNGTSFASPMFAGLLGIAQQKLIDDGSMAQDTNGNYRMGRLQDWIYEQNGSAPLFVDITSGANGTLPNGNQSIAGTGWDSVTGWGVMDMTEFVKLKSQKPVTFGPTDAVVYQYGTNTSGSYDNLSATDGTYYAVRSANIRNVGDKTQEVITITAAPNITTAKSVTFTISGYAPKTTTRFVYAYNTLTHAYDLLGSIQMTGSSVTSTFTTKTPAKYYDGSYNLKLLVMHLAPTRLSKGQYISYVDQSTATYVPKNVIN